MFYLSIATNFFKRWLIPGRFLRNVIASCFIIFSLQLPIVSSDAEPKALQYIAARLLPNECQSIVNQPVAYAPPTNEIDCFRSLAGWTSNLRTNRRDTHLVLGNRLRQIGRDDLATWLIGPPFSESMLPKETVEFESWDSVPKSNRKWIPSSEPTIQEIDKPMYGPPPMKSMIGLSPAQFNQQSLKSGPDVRKLNGIHSLDSYKDKSLAMVAESQSPRTAGSSPEHVSSTTELAGRGKDVGGIVKEAKSNEVSAKSSRLDGWQVIEDKKHEKSLHSLDDKCLRVPLSTALVVLGTIMSLTCCCALLLRNRLAAFVERLKGKKSNNKPRRLSIDEEQGFMGPRIVGQVPKRISSRKGGGPPDVANIGTQNSTASTNQSKESDERTTGCCGVSKKKKNRKKRKK